MAVFNSTASSRTDLARFRVEFDAGIGFGDRATRWVGVPVDFVSIRCRSHPDGSIDAGDDQLPRRRGSRRSATGSTGCCPPTRPERWLDPEGRQRRRERPVPDRSRSEAGRSLVRIYDKGNDRELLSAGEVGNELLAYGEYSTHPYYGEGPWHLVPDGRADGTASSRAEVTWSVVPSGNGSPWWARRSAVATPRRRCCGTVSTASSSALTWTASPARTRCSGSASRWTSRGRCRYRVWRVRWWGRTFGFPSVDVAEVPFTLDYPAYDWFGLSRCLKVELGEDEARAISVAEVVIPAGQDWGDIGDELAEALVKQGVTSTVSTDEDGRYGLIDLDSNLPDARISVGGPELNKFSSAVLDSADPGLGSGLRRRVSEGGSGGSGCPPRHHCRRCGQRTRTCVTRGRCRS